MVQSVSAAFDKLTPREREIFRPTAAHLPSKAVEMRVLDACRRLSGPSLRDAALAFVACEGGGPGNDYRRQPGDQPLGPRAGPETGR